MDDRTKEILQKIEEAEYVLVGLGQEFDMENLLEANPEYGKVREQLQKIMHYGFCPMLKSSSGYNI